MKTIICGIGNKMKGDDAVGSIIAGELRSENLSKEVLVLDCGSAPENFTGKIKTFGPEQVIIVDAVKMGREPGTVKKINPDNLQELLFSTHQASLRLLIGYIKKELPKTKMSFIGIEPKHTMFGENMSEEVMQALEEVKLNITKSLKGAK